MFLLQCVHVSQIPCVQLWEQFGVQYQRESEAKLVGYKPHNCGHGFLELKQSSVPEAVTKAF